MDHNVKNLWKDNRTWSIKYDELCNGVSSLNSQVRIGDRDCQSRQGDVGEKMADSTPGLRHCRTSQDMPKGFKSNQVKVHTCNEKRIARQRFQEKRSRSSRN